MSGIYTAYTTSSNIYPYPWPGAGVLKGKGRGRTQKRGDIPLLLTSGAQYAGCMHAALHNNSLSSISITMCSIGTVL